MNRTHRTPKGLELPLLNLRGREYLEVKYRLVWFREEHPDWAIETELLSVTENSASARAVIKENTGRVIATSHKFEDKKGFPDFMEKAETGAIGRALALCGYGTQFCADELDEGERIVDSPTETQQSRTVGTPTGRSTTIATPQAKAGDYVITFGKFKDCRLSEVPRHEIESYLDWLETDALQKGKPLAPAARALKVSSERYFAELDSVKGPPPDQEWAPIDNELDQALNRAIGKAE